MVALNLEKCPTAKLSDLLHYYSYNGTAYGVYVPLYYLLKMINMWKYNYVEPYLDTEFRFNLKRVILHFVVYLTNLFFGLRFSLKCFMEPQNLK